MLSHKQVWEGIDRLAAKHQLSASGLAKRAGLDPTTFNKSKRITKQGKARWPSTESVSKILEATNTSMRDFVDLMHGGTSSGPAAPSLRLRCMALGQLERSSALDASGFPVEGSWEELDHPVVDDKQAYAIELDRDVAPPVYRAGDLVLVSPTSSIRRADRIVARLRSGEFRFGVLARRTAHRLVLHSLQASEQDEEVIEADKVVWMVRVVWVSQ